MEDPSERGYRKKGESLLWFGVKLHVVFLGIVVCYTNDRHTPALMLSRPSFLYGLLIPNFTDNRGGCARLFSLSFFSFFSAGYTCWTLGFNTRAFSCLMHGNALDTNTARTHTHHARGLSIPVLFPRSFLSRFAGLYQDENMVFDLKFTEEKNTCQLTNSYPWPVVR